jgi:chemotaxis protein methyltransferase CheR
VGASSGLDAASIESVESIESIESIELEALLSAIRRRYGYDFHEYARASLRRRVDRALRAEGVESLSSLQGRILRDPACMRRFIGHLTVHVTSMFRDPEFYRVLRATVVPLLRTYPFVRIWHAGCSTGEEVYSLAILLEEEGLYERCRIYATDISDDLLQRARRGIFGLETVRQGTHNHHAAGGKDSLSAYYKADHGRVIMREALRRNVVFAVHNLVGDASFNEFHLILCRNVMIYFDERLRNRVHELLYQSLGRSGVLGLGIRESIGFTPHAAAYEPMGDRAVRLYRRVR